MNEKAKTMLQKLYLDEYDQDDSIFFYLCFSVVSGSKSFHPLIFPQQIETINSSGYFFLLQNSFLIQNDMTQILVFLLDKLPVIRLKSISSISIWIEA
ncbi:MAG: hypothetical protein CM1200mP10_20230 [Candidatus Neomarinimicrobiota bacterium]|nr:MAG: hypothetical protein CM1200mP10_20230 [Candidatus Neomarinimicrobiota bacterium]